MEVGMAGARPSDLDDDLARAGRRLIDIDELRLGLPFE
jgi:hypothetical protein